MVKSSNNTNNTNNINQMYYNTISDRIAQNKR